MTAYSTTATACPVVIDATSSTVTIAGRTWPACSLVCPQHERDEPRDRWSHTLDVGSSDYQLDVYVPSESGVIVELTVFQRDGHWRIDLACVSRYCIEVGHAGDWCWLPAGLKVASNIAYGGRRASRWHDCDPEWVNEHIDRLFRMDVDVSLIAANPTVDLIPVAIERTA